MLGIESTVSSGLMGNKSTSPLLMFRSMECKPVMALESNNLADERAI